jgi:hypothetical protein
MAQEITVGTLARLTDSFTIAEVWDDDTLKIYKEDCTHFVRGTVVEVLHLFEGEGCPQQAVIYSEVLKEATTCAVDFLEPMKVIHVSGYVPAGKMIRG